MPQKKPKTPEYRIVEVRKDRLRPVRTASTWLFRLLLLGLALGVLIYNQYALSSAVRTVEELKRSLLLKETEYPIKKILDERTQGRLNELERIQIAKLIKSKEAEGIDPHFTLDLIQRESSCNPNAVSNKGALGLMQLLPSTARWMATQEGISWEGEEALFDPLTNVRLGMAYLVHLAKEFKGERLLRAAYQNGPTWVQNKMGEGGIYAGNP